MKRDLCLWLFSALLLAGCGSATEQREPSRPGSEAPAAEATVTARIQGDDTPASSSASPASTTPPGNASDSGEVRQTGTATLVVTGMT